MSLFTKVKAAIPTRLAAERYGIYIRSNGMARCPFHSDRTPSMKLDQRFHCFGCQADGDVIDFTARLFGLSCKEAARKLAEDFSLFTDTQAIHCEARSHREELEEQLARIRHWRHTYAPANPGDPWHPSFVQALQQEADIAYQLACWRGGARE